MKGSVSLSEVFSRSKKIRQITRQFIKVAGITQSAAIQRLSTRGNKMAAQTQTEQQSSECSTSSGCKNRYKISSEKQTQEKGENRHHYWMGGGASDRLIFEIAASGGWRSGNGRLVSQHFINGYLCFWEAGRMRLLNYRREPNRRRQIRSENGDDNAIRKLKFVEFVLRKTIEK